MYGFTDNAVKLGGLPTALLTLTFETCQGAPAATAGDFTCTVTDVSDDNGNVVDSSNALVRGHRPLRVRRAIVRLSQVGMSPRRPDRRALIAVSRCGQVCRAPAFPRAG